jgi:hypothetical protein
MDDKYELPPHIDASDFDNKWWEPGTTGQAYVPVRSGFKEVGRVSATLGKGKVELRVLSGEGAVSNGQSVALKRFKTAGEEHLCLGCQLCGKLHKRLFMVAVPKKGRLKNSTSASAFTCKKCGGIDEERKRHTRQLNKKYARKAGWAWAR